MSSILTKYQKLQTEIRRINSWNRIAGKANVLEEGGDPVALQTAINNQKERVEEEIGELMETMKKRVHITDPDIKKEYYIGILDDVCDIMVTAAFYRTLTGMTLDIPQDQVSAAIVEQLDNITFDNCYQMVGMMALQETPNFDFIGGLEAVNDNNFEKFVKLNSYGSTRQIDETVAMYDEQGVETYVAYNEGYAVILRCSDDKVMKPAGFIGVDLSPFIFC